MSAVQGWPPYRQLMPAAQMWPRCSPLADSVAPVLSQDTSPPLPPLVVPADDPPVVPVCGDFNLPLVQQWASDYPFPRVFQLAFAAMNQTLDPFMGQRSHPVPQEDRKASEEDRLIARGMFLSARQRGNMDGPRRHRPFAVARDLPWGLALKHRYVPSLERRLTSDLSASWMASKSVNQMTWSPHMRRVHFAPAMTRDMMVWMGPDGTVSLKDVPKCFRAVKNSPRLLHLFVYKLVTAAFGVEFWTDLANPFGWVASEWGWQCCLAIIEWVLYKRGVFFQKAFVDNFHIFHLPVSDPRPVSPIMSQCPRRSPSQPYPIGEVTIVDEVFDSLGIRRHEEELVVRKFSSLGWDWNWRSTGEFAMIMSCREDKYAFYLARFRVWAAATSMSVQDLASAVGIMVWLCAGFAILAANVAPISKLKSEGMRVCKHNSIPPKAKMMQTTVEIRQGFEFVVRLFEGWDRTCPVVMGFGPCSSAHVRGWVDACTGKRAPPVGPAPFRGCGGLCLDVEAGTLRGFVHEWSVSELQRSLRGERESSAFLEALGVLWWLQTFRFCRRARRVLLAVDSDPTMLALKRAFSDCGLLNGVVREIRTAVAVDFTVLRVRSILGAVFNIIADHLSHDRVEEAVQLAWRQFGLRMVVSRV